MVGDSKVSSLNWNSALWNLLELPTLDLKDQNIRYVLQCYLNLAQFFLI
jgi:hypothetical protein